MTKIFSPDYTGHIKNLSGFNTNLSDTGKIMEYTTPLSRLSDRLRINRTSMNHATIINETCIAADNRISDLEEMLASAVARIESMTQTINKEDGDIND